MRKFVKENEIEIEIKKLHTPQRIATNIISSIGEEEGVDWVELVEEFKSQGEEPSAEKVQSSIDDIGKKY